MRQVKIRLCENKVFSVLDLGGVNFFLFLTLHTHIRQGEILNDR